MNRSGIAVLLAASSVPVWMNFDTSDFGISCGLVALTMCIASLVLPGTTGTHLDINEGKIVTHKYYSFLKLSTVEQPLSDFSRIVVRHLCHPGGEADDTFSGAVGLKPASGGPVFWVKEFEATKDEFPTAAYEFAKVLHDWTGLPYPVWEERE